jgi:hypothetical protein
MDAVDQGQEDHSRLIFFLTGVDHQMRKARASWPCSRHVKKIGMVWVVFVLQSCGLITQQSIYEGVRSQEKIKGAGQSALPPPLPSYQDYEAERERLKRAK